MRHLAIFVTLLCLATASPLVLPSLSLQPSPIIPSGLIQQINGLLVNIENLLSEIKTSTPAGNPINEGLVIRLLKQVKVILINTLGQLEAAPSTIVNQGLIKQLTQILGKTENLLNSAVDKLAGGLEDTISGIVGDVVGIVNGENIQAVPGLLTTVVQLLTVIIDGLV